MPLNQNPFGLTDEQIDDLKAKAGVESVHLLTTDEEDQIIVKAPSKPVFEKYKSLLLDDKKRIKASEILVRDCLVYPDRADFEQMIQAKPFLIETFAQEIAKLGGAREQVEVKKL